MNELPIFPEVIIDFSQVGAGSWDVINICVRAAQQKNVPMEEIRNFMIEAADCARFRDLFDVCNKWFTIR